MSKTPKKPPPTQEDMLAFGTEKRQRSKLYKSEAYAFNAECLSKIAGNTKAQLVKVTKSDKIPLSDTETVKAQAALYLESCEKTASLPSITGLALALGYSRRAIYDCINRQRPPDTARFLELFRDACSEALQQASLQGSVNTIASIFIQKAVYQLRETVEVAVAAPTDPLGSFEETPEEIAKRYLKALPEKDFDD